MLLRSCVCLVSCVVVISAYSPVWMWASPPVELHSLWISSCMQIPLCLVMWAGCRGWFCDVFYMFIYALYMLTSTLMHVGAYVWSIYSMIVCLFRALCTVFDTLLITAIPIQLFVLMIVLLSQTWIQTESTFFSCKEQHPMFQCVGLVISRLDSWTWLHPPDTPHWYAQSQEAKPFHLRKAPMQLPCVYFIWTNIGNVWQMQLQFADLQLHLPTRPSRIIQLCKRFTMTFNACIHI